MDKQTTNHPAMDFSTRPNRTWLCSVVFLDIVEYTLHPISEQITLKNRFMDIIQSVAKRYFSNDELFMVDSGDGAALCYLGDPEDMLFCAQDLLSSFTLSEGNPGELNIPVRIGINLGPIKIHISVTGQPNPIGDGINVAQRIMSFARPGQILVSRSFYEVVGCLSDEYTCMFTHVGTRKDKHIREHDLYRVLGKTETHEHASNPLEAHRDRINISPAANDEPSTDNQNQAPGHTSQTDTSFCAYRPAIENALATYLGPIGKVLVRRELNAATDPDVVIRNLAAHIEGAADRDAFLRKAENLLLQAKSELATARPAPAARAPATIATPASTPSTTHWHPGELEQITTHLSDYLGPLSKVLVRKLSVHARDITTLYRLLAEHIPHENERQQFLSEAGILK